MTEKIDWIPIHFGPVFVPQLENWEFSKWDYFGHINTGQVPYTDPHAIIFLGDHEIGSQEILDYCYRILDQSLLSFIYQFIVNDGPNPFEFDKFCNDFKKKNVSIIVVEMATDAITVATKDKKFTFESQVSNIGM